MPRQGSQHHCAVLTEARVRAARRLYYVKHWNINCIARAYGVSYGAVYDAVKFYTWPSVRPTSDVLKALKVMP